MPKLMPNLMFPRPTASSLKRSAASAIVGYFLGTVPSANIAARFIGDAKAPISEQGTGNPGAANVTALMGKKAGAAVMAADVAKAAAASVMGRSIIASTGGHIAGTAAVVGHCYPIWSGFRNGGKGIAASMGQMLATFPAYIPVDIGLGVLMSKSERWRDRQTQSTAMACGLWVVLSATWERRQFPNLWGGRPTRALPVAAFVSSLVIISRFRQSPGTPQDASTPKKARTGAPNEARTGASL